MATEYAVSPLDQGFVTLLGEPTGWVKLAQFSTDGVGGDYMIYSNTGLIRNDLGFPCIREGNATNVPGAHLDPDNPTDPPALTDWKEYDGNPVGTGTVPYVAGPTTAGQQAVYGAPLSDGKQLIVHGDIGTSAVNRCSRFDPENNTWEEQYFSALPQQYSPSTPAVLCLAGDGNVYSFAGANSGGTHHMYTYRLDGTSWTQLATNTQTDGVDYFAFAGGFAVPLPGNKVWVGGGRRSGPSKQGGTWIYDIDADTFTKSAVLDVAVIGDSAVWQWMPAAALDDGRAIIHGNNWAKVFDPSDDSLSDLAVSDGNIFNHPDFVQGTTFQVTNTTTPRQTMFPLPDGRLFAACRSTGSWVSTHD